MDVSQASPRSRSIGVVAGAAIVATLVASMAVVPAAHGLTTTVYAAIDNKVAVTSKNPSIEDTVFGKRDLGIGCLWELYYYDEVAYQDFFCVRTLIQFDIDSLIAGTTIQSALLRVYPYLVPTDLDTTHSVAPISTEWNPPRSRGTPSRARRLRSIRSHRPSAPCSRWSST
jgi:hypothetical protein